MYTDCINYLGWHCIIEVLYDGCVILIQPFKLDSLRKTIILICYPILIHNAIVLQHTITLHYHILQCSDITPKHILYPHMFIIVTPL